MMVEEEISNVDNDRMIMMNSVLIYDLSLLPSIKELKYTSGYHSKVSAPINILISYLL